MFRKALYGDDADGRRDSWRDGDMPRPTGVPARDGILYDRCCPRAKIVLNQCVCEYQTDCPEHGKQCHGTHD